MDSNSWKHFDSKHYRFHARVDSIAQREIAIIEESQESCFRQITRALGGTPSMRINYFLYTSPVEVGVAYGDGEPTNAFARMPDSIHAVYNESVKCIGFHEDAHIISYDLYGRPKDVFIREGLAMYFDRKWWGLPNEIWTDYYYRKATILSLTDFMENEAFFATDCHITYPVCGAFCTYLITIYGIEAFIHAFSLKGTGTGKRLVTVYGKSPKCLEETFQAYIQRQGYGKTYDQRIAQKLSC